MQLAIDPTIPFRAAQDHPALKGKDIREALELAGVLGRLPATVETVLRWSEQLTRIEDDFTIALVMVAWAGRQPNADPAIPKLFRDMEETHKLLGARLREVQEAVLFRSHVLPEGMWLDRETGSYVLKSPHVVHADRPEVVVDREAFLRP